MASRTIAIEVPDDSILARKEIQIRPAMDMKQKHLVALRGLVRFGTSIDAGQLTPDAVFDLMDELGIVLEGLLIGWSADDIAELTFNEQLLIYNQIGAELADLLPNGNSSSSKRPTPRGTSSLGRRGSARSS